jgi:hypothetical protein
MKKVQVSPLQEILDTHIIRVQDYLEESLKMMFDNYLESSSGVISGLEPSAAGGLVVNLSDGSIMVDGIFGELEAPTGILLEGSSTTRVDLLVASYEEILDTFSSGYILLDVVNRAEQIVSLPGRRFGTIVIEQLKDTNYLNRPSNKIPLCEVTITNTGITSLTDYRLFSTIGRFKKELQIGFNSLFYGSLY